MNQLELQAQLKRQLNFIKRSCESFDKGFDDEAIRIATAIRVLIHQTNNSDSLLKLLGIRDTLKLTSSIEQPTQQGLYFFDGVSMLADGSVKPMLEFFDVKSVDVSTWWEEVAIVSSPQMVHTRKSIVLGAANKDGGAHVDPSLTPEYEELKKGLYTVVKTNFSSIEEKQEIPDHQFFALRVFAQELLNSPELLKMIIDPAL